MMESLLVVTTLAGAGEGDGGAAGAGEGLRFRRGALLFADADTGSDPCLHFGMWEEALLECSFLDSGWLE